MPSSIIDSAYYRDMFGTAAMRTVFSDDARLEAWLAIELALARAQVRTGVIPAGVDERLAAVATVDHLDQDAMKAEFDRVGFPILPFVKELTKACDPETARWVHYATAPPPKTYSTPGWCCSSATA